MKYRTDLCWTYSTQIILSLLLSNSFCLNNIIAQEIGNYHFELISIDEGLPSHKIQTIFQDKKDRLWLGTPNGLVLYDGYEFVQFSPAKGLNIGSINSITQDHSENIWIAGSHGVSVWDGASFNSNASIINISNISCDQSGDVWFSAGSELLVMTKPRIDEIGNHGIKPDLVYSSESGIIHDLEIKNNDVFIILDSGILRVAPGRNISTWYNADGEVTSKSKLFAISEEEILWSNQYGNIRRITQENRDPLVDLNIQDPEIVFDLRVQNDLLHVLVYQGIHVLENKLIGTIEWPKEMQIIIPYCMHIDDQNTIWVGTSEGLLICRPSMFKNIRIPPEMSFSFSAMEIKNNDVLIGLNHGQVAKISQGKLHPEILYKVTKEGEVMDMLENEKGGIWLLTLWNGLVYMVNGRQYKFFYGSNHNDEPDCKCIYQDNEDNLWVGCLENIYRIKVNESNPDQSPIEKFGIGSAESLQIIQDKFGNLWAATTQGLARWNNNKFDLVHTQDSLLNISIHAMLFENQNIWLATYGHGLIKTEIDQNQIIHLEQKIDSEVGLLNDYLDDIIQDQAGNFWVSSATGLSRIDKKNYNIQNYSSYEVNMNSNLSTSLSLIGEDEILMTASRNLFIWNPENLASQNTDRPIIYLNRIQANGKNLDFARDLKHSENSITFEFSQYDPLNAKFARYRHKLNEEPWSSAHTNRSINYQSLSPGDYFFQVITSNVKGSWSEPAAYHFTIRPAWWALWWLRTIFFVLLAGSVLFFTKRRTRKLINEEKRKMHVQQIIKDLESRSLRTQMNPHFVFNCLNAIQEQILSNQVDSAYTYLSKFSELLRIVMEQSSSRAVKILDEIQMLNLYLELESLRFKETPFDFEITCEKDIDFIRIPSLMIQPFVENAIHHGLIPKKNHMYLTIDFKANNEVFICTIRDNGIGRSASLHSRNKLYAKRYHATQVVQDRINIINSLSSKSASLEIKDLASAEGTSAGTQVNLKIPLDWMDSLDKNMDEV